MQYPIRINKYLAEEKYSTRVGGDALIKKGLVFVNGKKAIIGQQVYKEDKVEVRSDKIKKDYVYYAYNKKINVSTNKEPRSKDILSVTKFPERVFPVGRLDKDSHGLIILSNDGRITDRLLSPKHVHEKEYIVKVEPNFTHKFIELMSSGVRFDKYVSKKCEVWPYKTRTGESKNIFNIILTEGKKRQIRRMCEALHHKVIDLKRIRIMNINIGSLKDGEYKKIEGKELETFLNLLGLGK